MLRKVRLVLAVISFVLVTLLFLDFTGTLHGWLGWLAKIQFLPSLLALNVGIVIGLVLLTFVFGRIYCSVICPLGIFQDVIAWFGKKGKKRPYTYSPARSWLRYSVLALFIIAMVAGVSAIVSLLDPYGAYGRIANNLFAPVWQWGNNTLAYLAERVDSYAFYEVDIWIKSLPTFIIAALTLVVLIVLAWRNGRTYCNTICPVGTVLGFISRFSILKPTFDTEKCTKCGLCERNCKASCIDSKNLTIDQSRCVTCFDCIEQCKFGAMKYSPRVINGKKSRGIENTSSGNPEEKGGISRMNFLSITGLFALTQTTVKAQQLLQADGGLADIEDKKMPDRKTRIVPPGAESLGNMNAHCTACQLCVSVCPNNILQPSNKLSTFMQPEITYERGYCRSECVKCSEVCPTGAIKRITTADKTAISIGQAVWIKDNCIVNRDSLPCTICERHCPTKAIILVPLNPEGENKAQQQTGFPGNQPPVLKIPTIDKELCIGCGACEHLCPARPFSAIYVEGNVRHHSV